MCSDYANVHNTKIKNTELDESGWFKSGGNRLEHCFG